jgi:hypothetical protein
VEVKLHAVLISAICGDECSVLHPVHFTTVRHFVAMVTRNFVMTINVCHTCFNISKDLLHVYVYANVMRRVAVPVVLNSFK